MGGYKVLTKDRATIQAAVASGGPVIIYFSVQSSFYRYSGGIYPASSCSGTAVNHAMVRAGSGWWWMMGGGLCVGGGMRMVSCRRSIPALFPAPCLMAHAAPLPSLLQVVVGYDFTGPTPYWIVRNSWGGAWGTGGGYAFIEATADTVGTCKMYSGLIQPLATAAKA